METQDFKIGWTVEIVGHRNHHFNGITGLVENIKNHIIVIYNPIDGELIYCMAHELRVLTS